MYPVVMNGWVRLRMALIFFVAGGLLTIPVVQLPIAWYSFVPMGLMFGGMVYLLYSNEWLRIVWEKKARSRASRTIVRVGTLIFFLGGASLSILRVTPLGIWAALSGAGAAVVGVGFLLEWKNLPLRVEEAAQRAFELMGKTGHGIGANVWVVVEPDSPHSLPYLAYHYRSGGESVIKVSAWGVHLDRSGGLDVMIVHEMSHIYGTEKKHPSHNSEIIAGIVEPLFQRRGFERKYQWQTINRLLTHLKEVYANDTMFKVLRGSNTFRAQVGAEWYQSYVESKPVKSRDPKRRKWMNTALLVANASAISQMIRQGIPDTDDKAKRDHAKLLSALPADSSGTFEYFLDLMAGLKENVTDEEFRNLLAGYLSKFVEVAEDDLVGTRTEMPGEGDSKRKLQVFPSGPTTTVGIGQS